MIGSGRCAALRQKFWVMNARCSTFRQPCRIVVKNWPWASIRNPPTTAAGNYGGNFRNCPETYFVVSFRGDNYPVLQMLRLVLFDIDGTLIHTDSAGIRAFAKVFELQFKVANATHGVRFAGRTDTSLAREIFQLHGI